MRHLAAEADLRQFLDIGAGIPNRDNAHGAAPDSRVVYVDNDPVVLAHAHRLLQGRPRDRTAFLDGDLREPEEILAAAAEILDFTRPVGILLVGILLVGILHVVADADAPHGIVTSLVDAVAPGSHLAISQLTSDVRPEQMSVVSERLDKVNVDTNPPTFRSRDAITRFFQGLEQLEPGVVPVDRWRPDGAAPPGATDRETPLYGWGRPQAVSGQRP